MKKQGTYFVAVGVCFPNSKAHTGPSLAGTRGLHRAPLFHGESSSLFTLPPALQNNLIYSAGVSLHDLCSLDFLSPVPVNPSGTYNLKVYMGPSARLKAEDISDDFVQKKETV